MLNMSNFTCEKCSVNIVDSPTGYIQGCKHYPPEKTGFYECKIKHPTNGYTINRLLFKDGEWVLDNKDDLLQWNKEEL